MPYFFTYFLKDGHLKQWLFYFSDLAREREPCVERLPGVVLGVGRVARQASVARRVGGEGHHGGLVRLQGGVRELRRRAALDRQATREGKLKAAVRTALDHILGLRARLPCEGVPQLAAVRHGLPVDERPLVVGGVGHRGRLPTEHRLA